MTDKNATIYNLSTLLGASKNISYKASIIRAAASLMKFLHENKLLVDITPFDENGELKLDLVIREKNLTREGDELFEKGIIDKWEQYLDKSNMYNKYENISHLEKGLMKIKKKDDA